MICVLCCAMPGHVRATKEEEGAGGQVGWQAGVIIRGGAEVYVPGNMCKAATGAARSATR